MSHRMKRHERAVAWTGVAVLAAAGAFSASVQQTSANAAPLSGSVTAGAQSCGTCNGNSGNGAGNGATGTTPAAKSLTVTAAMRGELAPGAPATLAVLVANPDARPVLLKSLTVAVSSVAGGARVAPMPCDKEWIVIAPMSGTRTIASKGRAEVLLPVTFSDSATINQDNCKGATYGYNFTAVADQA